jgi:hypothetical protein
MNIKISYRDVDEIEEFCGVRDEPEIIKKNGIPMLFIQCKKIDNEWYVPLCNVLWWEIAYEEQNVFRQANGE